MTVQGESVQGKSVRGESVRGESVRGESVGVVTVTKAGKRLAERIGAALPDQVTVINGPTAAEGLKAGFAQYDAVVAVMAAGAVVRILAPQIAAGQKSSDPAIVVIDEAGRFVIPILGGHAAAANKLAAELAEILGAEAVVTTATDVAGVPGLDDLGWPVSGDVSGVGRALLDGEKVMLCSDVRWPLPALGENVVEVLGDTEPVNDPTILISDLAGAPTGVCTVLLRPPSLVAGMGASRGVSTDEVRLLLRTALEDAGLAVESVVAIATAQVKGDEQALIELARELAIPLVTHSAAALDQVSVPNPSEIVRAAVGVASVSEAAALLGVDGSGQQDTSSRRNLGTLIVTKTASAMATVAVARHQPRGRLAVVGLGPGSRELLTEAAKAELRRASVIVGLDQYVDQIRDLLRPGTQILSTGLGHEEERAHSAVELARDGSAVALVGSGDAGVYAMASPALEVADQSIEFVGVPGVTAALAASAVLGAPLGHDHCYLSLSDLHTPWPVIERRITAAAQGDLVLLCYNPRSVKRD
ncbi:MAG: cobalt-precorrin hydrolase / cobalt-factor methyltransferase / precorrin-3B, partial [Actinomycetota bacterium]|nr:cobalt-precorrin hydrolase / cobalt-factor methyltransferase / precorrin-3B [Actinomycetota bacterium]